MAIDEFANWPRFRAAIFGGWSCPLSLHGKRITRFSINEHAFFWG